MFKNPGKKLQSIANVVFWIVAALSSVACLNMIFGTPEGFKLGLTEILVCVFAVALSILVAWLFSLMIYAVGSLVDDTQNIREMMEDDRKN